MKREQRESERRISLGKKCRRASLSRKKERKKPTFFFLLSSLPFFSWLERHLFATFSSRIFHTSAKINAKLCVCNDSSDKKKAFHDEENTEMQQESSILFALFFLGERERERNDRCSHFFPCGLALPFCSRRSRVLVSR